ncbi:hypothetical protein EV715DRAFT_268553, partial [Schizophyllum commune]
NHLHKQVGDLRDEASRRSDQAVLVQEFVEPMEEQDSPQLIVDEVNWSAVSLPWRYGTDSLAVRGPHPSRNWLLLRTAPATKMVDLTARPSALPPMCSIHHRPLIPPGYLRQLKDFYRGLFLWYGPSIRRLTSAYIPLEKRRHSEIDVDEEIEDRDVLRHDGLPFVVVVFMRNTSLLVGNRATFAAIYHRLNNLAPAWLCAPSGEGNSTVGVCTAKGCTMMAHCSHYERPFPERVVTADFLKLEAPSSECDPSVAAPVEGALPTSYASAPFLSLLTSAGGTSWESCSIAVLHAWQASAVFIHVPRTASTSTLGIEKWSPLPSSVPASGDRGIRLPQVHLTFPPLIPSASS